MLRRGSWLCGMIVTSVLVCCCGVRLRAADEVKAEELLPDQTLAAVLVPDLAVARAAAQKTHLAEMYAQPEIQEFLAPAVAQMKKTYEELRAKNPLIPAWADFDAGLLSGEMAVAVYARPNLNPPYGVLATFKPQDLEAFKRLLPPKVRPILVDGMALPLAGVPDGPALAFMAGRILVCEPQSDLASVLDRIRDAAVRAKGTLAVAPEFVAARAKIANAAALVYVAPQRVQQVLLQQIHAPAPVDRAKVEAALRALGFDRINSLAIGLGVASAEPVCETYLGYSAPVQDSLLGLFQPSAPISAAGLRIAGVKAPYVSACSFQFAKLPQVVEKVLQGLDPAGSAILENMRQMARQVLQFDLEKDIFENLGEECVLAQTVIDTSAPLSFMPGVVGTVPVKDPAKLEECLKKLGAVLEKAGGENLSSFRLKRVEHLGKPIYYLSGIVFAGPAAFAVTDGRLLVGTSLNAVRRGLEQLAQPESILSNKSFQETIARLTGQPFDAAKLPSSFAYAADHGGGGGGALLLAGAGLVCSTAVLSGLAELPAMPGAGGGGDMGSNEQAAVRCCISYAQAQEIYRRTDYNQNGILEYSQTLKGDNSLAELKAGANDLGLIDHNMAAAEGEPDGKTSYKGYRFKVLKGQGDHAAGGKRNYVVNGNMTLGYALIAYPVQYGVSGKRCFIINNNGAIFARDFGPETAAAVSKLELFDPDAAWTVYDPDDFNQRPRDEFSRVLSRPAGKTALAIANAVDLGLWPDESFFARYRRATGSISIITPEGCFTRSELPPPGPASTGGIGALTVVSGTAIVAAIAIPSLLRSRMAANETAAAAGCRAYAEAQEIYRRTDYNRDGVLEYAQALKGDNSLLETKAGLGDLALIDRTFAMAEGGGPNAAPKAGYYFKILKAQGPKATGGKREYVVNGHMTLGYALVAWPAAYDGTGRNTFIISNNGTIFQRDLGPETPVIAAQMTEFNPDENWVATE